MKYTVKEVLQFVEANSIRFVRLAFFDVFGREKNVTVMSSELKTVFEKGMPVSAGMVEGLEHYGTLLLFPEPNTLKVVTWHTHQGAEVRLLCSLCHEDGTAVKEDVRQVLKAAVNKIKSDGLNCFAGISSEFYLFNADENGNKTEVLYDRAGFMDTIPHDKSYAVRNQACMTLEDMEITPVSSCHKAAPGQNEIMLKHVDIMTAADQYPSLKLAVGITAALNGLYAEFSPESSDMHSELKISLIIAQARQNLLTDKGRGMSAKAQGFISGILRRASEMTLFARPKEESYERTVSCQGDYKIGWSYNKPDTLLQTQICSSERARLEIRGIDPSCDLYMVMSLIMYAGMEGIRDGLNLKEFSSDMTLPKSRSEAVSVTEKSSFVREVVPQEILRSYLL